MGELKAYLEALNSIRSVTVVYDGAGSGLCSVSSAQLTFTQEFGSLPIIEAVANSDLTGGTISTSSVTIGTKENAECSNRGVCNRFTGVCDCFEGYGSSDGSGNVGIRNDCGRI